MTTCWTADFAWSASAGALRRCGVGARPAFTDLDDITCVAADTTYGLLAGTRLGDVYAVPEGDAAGAELLAETGQPGLRHVVPLSDGSFAALGLLSPPTLHTAADGSWSARGLVPAGDASTWSAPTCASRCAGGVLYGDAAGDVWRAATATPAAAPAERVAACGPSRVVLVAETAPGGGVLCVSRAGRCCVGSAAFAVEGPVDAAAYEAPFLYYASEGRVARADVSQGAPSSTAESTAVAVTAAALLCPGGGRLVACAANGRAVEVGFGTSSDASAQRGLARLRRAGEKRKRLEAESVALDGTLAEVAAAIAFVRAAATPQGPPPLRCAVSVLPGLDPGAGSAAPGAGGPYHASVGLDVAAAAADGLPPGAWSAELHVRAAAQAGSAAETVRCYASPLRAAGRDPRGHAFRECVSLHSARPFEVRAFLAYRLPRAAAPASDAAPSRADPALPQGLADAFRAARGARAAAAAADRASVLRVGLGTFAFDVFDWAAPLEQCPVSAAAIRAAALQVSAGGGGSVLEAALRHAEGAGANAGAAAAPRVASTTLLVAAPPVGPDAAAGEASAAARVLAAVLGDGRRLTHGARDVAYGATAGDGLVVLRACAHAAGAAGPPAVELHLSASTDALLLSAREAVLRRCARAAAADPAGAEGRRRAAADGARRAADAAAPANALAATARALAAQDTDGMMHDAAAARTADVREALIDAYAELRRVPAVLC